MIRCINPHHIHFQITSSRLSPRIEAEGNLLHSYKTSLSQLHSSFCTLQSSHSYRKRIELNSNTLCPSCRKEQHATVHNFSCPSHPTSLTKKDIRERPSLSFEFLFGFHFFYLLSLPPPELPPSNRLLN